MSGGQQDVDLVARGRWNTSGEKEAAIDHDAVALIVSGCEKSLQESGIIGALRFLNGRTRYRYTGVYHVEPPLLRNIHLFDRENPTLNLSGEVKPLHETYCGIVRETNNTVRFVDALENAHLDAHPAREMVLSYCGVPIRSEDGLTSGTLCHYDGRPRLLSAQETQILEGAASLFARWLNEWSCGLLS